MRGVAGSGVSGALFLEQFLVKLGGARQHRVVGFEFVFQGTFELAAQRLQVARGAAPGGGAHRELVEPFVVGAGK